MKIFIFVERCSPFSTKEQVKGWFSAITPATGPTLTQIQYMKLTRSAFLLSAVLLVIWLLPGAIAQAQQAFAYKCPKCGLVQTYSRPGLYKCPNDGWTMVQAN